jgi:hypothetical protein
MSKPTTFTRHAEQKFVDLAELGFAVTREQVIETVQMPDYVDHVVDPPIAQKGPSHPTLNTCSMEWASPG